MAIDVGASCIDRATYWGGGSSGITLISQTNPANATGLIFYIAIYSQAEMTDIEVAAFSASGDDLTTRGYTSLTDASDGLNEYSAPASFSPFEIRSGDYIGIFFKSQTNEGIERDLSDGPVWWVGGDQIPCSGVTFTSAASNEISLYATGYELGKINIGDSFKIIQNIEINIGDSWKQLSDLKINIGDVWKDGLT